MDMWWAGGWGRKGHMGVDGICWLWHVGKQAAAGRLLHFWMGRLTGRAHLAAANQLICNLHWPGLTQQPRATWTSPPHPQDWSDFAELMAEVVSLVDSGQLSEAEAEERMEGAVMYEVGSVPGPLWCPHASVTTRRCIGPLLRHQS